MPYTIDGKKYSRVTEVTGSGECSATATGKENSLKMGCCSDCKCCHCRDFVCCRLDLRNTQTRRKCTMSFFNLEIAVTTSRLTGRVRRVFLLKLAES